MAHPIRVPFRCVGVILVALALSGCAASHEVAHDLAVTNRADFFQVRWGSLETYTGRVSYEWTNSGSRATIRQECHTRDGLARIEIRDAAGIVVHWKNLRERGEFVTPDGESGVWKITVILDKATGSLDVTVKKKG